MDYHAYYVALFRPVVERIGELDPQTITAIIGFDAGGPVSLSTVGVGRDDFPTFVTCELSVRGDQVTAECPPFELLMTCANEDFARQTLTAIAGLSLQAALGDGHVITLADDLSAPGVEGVVLEEFARVEVNGTDRAILRVIGVDRRVLSTARDGGVPAALEQLRREGTYPITHIRG